VVGMSGVADGRMDGVEWWHAHGAVVFFVVVVVAVVVSTATAMWRQRGRDKAWQVDDISRSVTREARRIQANVPELSSSMHSLILGQPGLEAAVAAVIAARLADSHLQPPALVGLVAAALSSPETRSKLRADLRAVVERDPAAEGPLNVLLNFKGFHALETYRAAHVLYNTPNRRALALWLQSRASQVFGADIHPAARLGEGLFLDHATGVVIGATAVTGPNCSFLHGVTLGATGKDGAGDRHPKLGANVLVGCLASILGNIKVGDNAKIGASSIVLRPIPAGATAVGVPAKVIGGTPPAGKPIETVAGKEQGMSAADAPLSRVVDFPVDTDLSLSDCHHSFCCVWSFLTQHAEEEGGCPSRITYPLLREMLEPLGVEEFDISTLFFNLDIEHNGAISLDDFQSRWDAAVKACPKFAARSEELLKGVCAKMRAARLQTAEQRES